MIEGIKVLSFTHYLQGPIAAQTLADLGADVVKIERINGSYERTWSGGDSKKNNVSVFFLVANRNQRSLAIDLKSIEGIQLIYKLIEIYDVVLTNFKPAVMDRLGLSYKKLKSKNPKLIYCSCSGWGEDGPYSKADGQDLLVQGISGLAAQNGPGDRPPCPVGATAVDIHGGTLAALGILAAIYEREKTGIGHRVDVNLLNAAMDLQTEPFGYFLNSGQQYSRAVSGLGSRSHFSPYGIYKTKNGYIALNGHGEEEKIKAAFGKDLFNSLQFSFQNRLEIDKRIAKKLLKKTNEEWIRIFKECDIWYAPVNEYSDVENDPQVRNNEIVLEMQHPKAGRVRALNHANRFDGKILPLRMPPPELGNATLEILHECGFQEEDIKKFISKGIVKCRDGD